MKRKLALAALTATAFIATPASAEMLWTNTSLSYLKGHDYKFTPTGNMEASGTVPTLTANAVRIPAKMTNSALGISLFDVPWLGATDENAGEIPPKPVRSARTTNG